MTLSVQKGVAFVEAKHFIENKWPLIDDALTCDLNKTFRVIEERDTVRFSMKKVRSVEFSFLPLVGSWVIVVKFFSNDSDGLDACVVTPDGAVIPVN